MSKYDEMVEKVGRVLSYSRFWLGRHLIHLGLRILPPGRVRYEITEALYLWSEEVRRTLAVKAPPLTATKGAHQVHQERGI